MIITFLSDFGLEDEWVAVCKGIIKKIAPSIDIIDITHQIPSYNVTKGALVLAGALPYLPRGVHLAVVDPGVGTERKGLIIETQRKDFLVGPDNGLLIPASRRLGGMRRGFEISEEKYMSKPTCHTFEARDIFSPTAAYLATGTRPAKFGAEILGPQLTQSPWPEAKTVGQTIQGEVIDIDKFGTVRTNIVSEHLEKTGIRLEDQITLRHGSQELNLPFVVTFGDVKRGSPLLLVDSSGYLCVAVNEASAYAEFGMRVGNRVTVRKHSDDGSLDRK